MNELEYWRLKLVQTLHDPPTKPFAMVPGRGGHEKAAQALANVLFPAGLGPRKTISFYLKRPDRIASGADRPVVSPPARTETISPLPPVYFHKEGNHLITHPLAPGARLLLTAKEGAIPKTGAELDDAIDDAASVYSALRRVTDPQW